MKRVLDEQKVAIAATALVILLATGTAFAAGELELTLLMITAVTTTLVGFDNALHRGLRSVGPWMALSIAPVAKTAPIVWHALAAGPDALEPRYESAGSLLFGLCLWVAVAILAIPSPALGRTVAGFDAGVIAGSALVSGLAGASVAFLADARLGSETAGRILETPTWFVIGGVLAGVAIAASHSRQVPPALTGFLLTAAVTAAMLAYSVVGGEIGHGAWALVFAGLATSGTATDGAFGYADTRDRPSSTAVVVAVLVGLIGAASAVAARSDRLSWGPGWALLGIASVLMLALAVASKPVDEQLIAIEPSPAQRRRPVTIERISNDDLINDAPPSETQARVPGGEAAQAATTAVGPKRSQTPAPAPGIGTPKPAAGDSEVADPKSSNHSVSPEVPVAPQPWPAHAERPDERKKKAQDALAEESRTERQAQLSDGTFVASAKAAADIRTAPQNQRHSLAPLEQAHHFDPATGLLSAAGLQHALAQAFETPREAKHVTILLVAIRDLGQIERDHGRLAAAAVTQEVAERLSRLLPEGTAARFTRAAFAVVLLGDLADSSETVQRLARVLLQLRAPVKGTTTAPVDVVAGMAQCHEAEAIASFVGRANQALAQAVRADEPTFVAMP